RHGRFSLTPFVLLSVAGVVMGLRRRVSDDKSLPPTSKPLPSFLFPLTAVLSLVVVGFYLFKSDNYGGWTNGPRWLMWLTPLWLTCMLPLADRLPCCTRGRIVGCVLLGVSIFSVHYQLWNPWRHPWLYDFMMEMGWPGY